MAALHLLTLLGLIFSVSAIDVPVSTKYLTTEVTTLAQKSSVTLIGYLCGQAKGDGVNVTVVLNNNPTWILDVGVLYYYVVDSPTKTAADALCSNNHQGKVGPHCDIKSWPSAGDLYIKGTSGPVEAVSFSLDVEIIRAKGQTKPLAASKAQPMPTDVNRRGVGDPTKTVYLTEVITLTATSALPRLQEAHLNFSFCPTPSIGSQYYITSTVTGTDGSSSWALYICDRYPCELSSPGNIVAADGRELPVNTVITPSGKWKQMSALIVCWGGPYDPDKKLFIGHFQFNAIASKT